MELIGIVQNAFNSLFPPIETRSSDERIREAEINYLNGEEWPYNGIISHGCRQSPIDRDKMLAEVKSYRF